MSDEETESQALRRRIRAFKRAVDGDSWDVAAFVGDLLDIVEAQDERIAAMEARMKERNL